MKYYFNNYFVYDVKGIGCQAKTLFWQKLDV